MDAVIKPNVSFPFTVINASQFKSINTGQIFKSRIYNIPDYWFKDETALIEFSKTLKDSCDFIDYFFENLKYAVKNKFESTIILTLRTNTNIIFVKTDSEGYNNTIDKLIELNKNAKFLTCKNCRKKFTQTTHKGKKGSTTKTSNVLWADRSHKGSKGSTTTNYGGKKVIHKGKKGTTTVYSNKDGSKDVFYSSNDRKKSSSNKTIKANKK